MPDTDEARALAGELATFELRVGESGGVASGAFASSTHDDLVVALGVAVLEDSASYAAAWLEQVPARRGVMVDPVAAPAEAPEVVCPGRGLVHGSPPRWAVARLAFGFESGVPILACEQCREGGR